MLESASHYGEGSEICLSALNEERSGEYHRGCTEGQHHALATHATGSARALFYDDDGLRIDADCRIEAPFA